MSDEAEDDKAGDDEDSLFAPKGGWVVVIRDLSADDPEDPDAVEEVHGFETLMHANAFARAYVRDSVERCRVPGEAPDDVLRAWHAFGEDAEVQGAESQGWSSSSELGSFASRPGPASERDWRSLDPRRQDD